MVALNGSTDGEVEVGFAGLNKTASAEIEIHWRAERLPRPDYFYLEPNQPRRETAGSIDITRFHQVDPTRGVTLAGIMPNIALLQSAGNPYPTGPADPAIQGHMTWAPYVEVSHAYWRVLAQAKQALIGIEIARRAAFLISPAVARRMVDIERSKVGGHTLRDLRLYGLIGSDGYRDDVWSTNWAVAA